MSRPLKLETIANSIRKQIITLSHHAHMGHVGSSFSIVEILVALYFSAIKVDPKNPQWLERDRFVLSKGHAALALFTVLKEKGFFENDVLATYCQNGSQLLVHPEYNNLPGIDAGTGALGHGLPVAVGMAYAAKKLGQQYRVFVLVSDAELDEGTNWEAALFAGHHQLDNLTVIVDCNGTQALGKTPEVLDLEPLEDKWKAFRWNASTMDGHSITKLKSALEVKNRLPKVIIAKTIMGKGASFMEGNFHWHYYDPKLEHLNLALKELG